MPTTYRHGHTPRPAGSLAHLGRNARRGQVDHDFQKALAAKRAREAAAAAEAAKATPAPRSLDARRLAAVADMRAADYAALRGPKAVTAEWAAEELNISVKTVRAYVRAGRLELTELSVRKYAVRRIDNAIASGTTGWLAADNAPATPRPVVMIRGRVVNG